MEFPDIGERCFVGSCQQLDFLPVVCHFCKELFCVLHKARDSHQCPFSEDNKIAVAVGKSTATSYACELEECIATELVPVVCQDCCKNFCLRHRHQQDHDCEKFVKPVEPVLTAKEKVEAIIGRELKTVKKEPKVGIQSKTAAKVALMKLKMHAVGDGNIPQTDREYFSVQLPGLDSKDSNAPMFFSKIWSIGKIIDNISSVKRLANKNNVAKEKKLRLFNNDGEMLEASEILQHAIDQGEIQLESSRILKLQYYDGND